MATGCRRCGLFAVRRISTSNLEAKIAEFLGTEDTILYAAAFDANGGVFEPLFNEQDAIISDELNHASIIDGVRLCKAQRQRYKHDDMADLEAKLQETQLTAATALLLRTGRSAWMVLLLNWIRYVHWLKNIIRW